MNQKIFLCCFVLCFFQAGLVAASESPKPLYPGFPVIEESRAYEKLKAREVTDLSILHYLIDRYEESDIKIRYDHMTVSSRFAGKIARWFLASRYKGETPEQWILKWCHRTIVGDNSIWVLLPDGRYLLSREVLQQELDHLHAILKKA